MISGSLLLSREESVINTYKRIPRILIDLILFSLLYFWSDAIKQGYEFSVLHTMKNILQVNYWHLWYLYAYITFLISLPILRKLIKGLDLSALKYMVVTITLIMGIISIIESFAAISIYQYIEPSWMTNYVFIYPVVGYMLDHKVNVENIKVIDIAKMWFLNIICYIVSEVCQYNFLLIQPDSRSETFLNLFLLINSIVLFITVKYILERVELGKVLCKFITESGSCTFGIYLFHVWFLRDIPFLKNMWMCIEQDTIIGRYFGIYISCILVFCICGVITCFLRRVPLIKEFF